MDSLITIQHQLARLNLRRMQSYFSKVFPGCRVYLFTCEVERLTYLQIDGVISFLIERKRNIVYTKVFRHTDGGRLFMFDNSPKEGDRDKRMKPHIRMWNLFVASQQGKDVLSRWRIPAGNAKVNHLLESGLAPGAFSGAPELKRFEPPAVKPRRFPMQRFNMVVVQEGKEGSRRLDEFVTMLIQFRKVAEERIIVFTQNPILTGLVERMRQRIGQPFDFSIQWAQSLEELVECHKTAEIDKQDYVNLHLIIDAPDLVEIKLHSNNWFNTRSQTFKAIALQDVAEACPVISVIVPEQNIEKRGEQWADHSAV